jgi:hypothetical protein
MKIDLLKKIKNYLEEQKQQQEQEMLDKKIYVISLLENEWTEKEVENFNYTLIGNSAGWLGGDYSEKDIKKYILRHNKELFTEEEILYHYERINGVKVK